MIEREPSGSLIGLVRRLGYLDAPAPGTSERILPIPWVHAIINLGEPYTVLRHGETPIDRDFAGAFISGLQSTYLVNRNPARLHHVGAELEPWAWRAWGAEPVVDAVVDAEQVMPGIAAARRDALAAAGPAAAVDALERGLENALTGAHPDPVAAAIGRAIAADPSRRIGDVAREAGVDPASVARRFARATGTAPKAHARIHRLHRFLAQLSLPGPLPTWTALVADAPYYDQPHFNREFLRLTGATPRAYLAALGEAGRAAPSFVNGEVR